MEHDNNSGNGKGAGESSAHGLGSLAQLAHIFPHADLIPLPPRIDDLESQGRAEAVEDERSRIWPPDAEDMLLALIGSNPRPPGVLPRIYAAARRMDVALELVISALEAEIGDVEEMADALELRSIKLLRQSLEALRAQKAAAGRARKTAALEWTRIMGEVLT